MYVRLLVIIETSSYIKDPWVRFIFIKIKDVVLRCVIQILERYASYTFTQYTALNIIKSV